MKDGPVEIWDIKSMSMLSKMSKRFPPAVCMVNSKYMNTIYILITDKEILVIASLILSNYLFVYFLFLRNGFNVICQREKEVVYQLLLLKVYIY